MMLINNSLEEQEKLTVSRRISSSFSCTDMMASHSLGPSLASIPS